MLRDAGLDVHHGRLVDSIRGARTGRRPQPPGRVGHSPLSAGHRHEDIGRFDLAFDLSSALIVLPSPGLPLSRWASGRGSWRKPLQARRPSRARRVATGVGRERRIAGRAVGAYSATEHLSRTKDFAEFSECRARARAGVAGESAVDAEHPPDATMAARHSGAVDLRPLIRRNLMRGGD